MNIKVEYKKNNVVNNGCYKMSKVAFIKHLAFAGLGFAPRVSKTLRAFGLFLHYLPFMQRDDFNNDCFSTPGKYFYDPTEKGHFSNLAGKAIADFLSKQIDNSIFTMNYEAALKILQVHDQNERPDLIAFTSDRKIFAIESKGYTRSSVSSLKMADYKRQSQTGGIFVDFSVACVSYDLYNKVKCKYHDPENEKVKFDESLFKKLTKLYYSGLNEFKQFADYKSKQFADIKPEPFHVQREDFYKINLSNILLNEYGIKIQLINSNRCLKEVYLILPSKIDDYAENGISSSVEPFVFEENKERDDPYGESLYIDHYLYIDNDRVGILLK